MAPTDGGDEIGVFSSDTRRGVAAERAREGSAEQLPAQHVSGAITKWWGRGGRRVACWVVDSEWAVGPRGSGVTALAGHAHTPFSCALPGVIVPTGESEAPAGGGHSFPLRLAPPHPPPLSPVPRRPWPVARPRSLAAAEDQDR